MARVGKIAGAALAGAFIIESKKAITTTQDLTKSTISLHKNLGLTNKVASEWANVAKARGADTTKLGMAFKTLATQISGAGHGSQASIDMFKELGFSSADIERSMTDTQFAIGKVADGLNRLPAGADKAAFSSKLFGRGWQTIAPILRDGSAAMQEQLNTVQKYGGVIQGKTLKQQEDLLASLRENKIAWQGLQVQLATAVTPALQAASEQFQRIAQINADPNLTGEEKWKKISRIIENDLNKALDVAVKLIPEFASRMGEAAPKIAGALVRGFLGANVWGQMAIGAFLISKMGGWRAIAAAGTLIGRRSGASMAVGMSEGMAGGAAAGGGRAVVAGAGAGTLASRVGGALKGAGLLAGRAAGIAIGIAVAENVLSTVDSTVKAHSKDLQESLQGLAEGGGKPLQQKILDQTVGPFAGDIFGGSKAADAQQKAAKNLLGILGRIAETHGHISQVLIKEALQDQRILNLNGEQNAQINKQLASAQRFQEQMQGRRKGFGFAAALAEDQRLGGREIARILADLQKLPPGARKEASNTMIGMAKVFEQKGQLPKGSAKNLRDAVVQTYHGMNVKSVKESGKMAKGVATNSAALVNAVTVGLDILKGNVNQSLRAFGVKALKFTLKNPGKAGGALGSFVGAFGAKGGFAGQIPGYSRKDDRLIGVRGGEAVLRPEDHQPVVNAALGMAFGTNLQEMFDRTGAGMASKPGTFAGTVDRTGVPHFAKGGMAAMVTEANRFERRHFPYVWGGGHGGFGIQPVDCSGAVSDILHAGGLLNAPMVSGALASWGKAGKGPLTVYANPVHTVMSLAGKFFGTSSSNPGGGAGWIEGGFPSSYLSGFAARTMDVADGMAKHLARLILRGPAGPLRKEGQAALDMPWRAGNKYIDSKMPAGTFGGGQGLADFGKGPGKIVGASVYGFGEPGTGTVGASGVSLPGKPAFAELDMGTALGHLPFGKKLGIEVGGKQAVGTKLDIGAGGGDVAGHHRAIDFWSDLARQLGLSGSFLGLAKVKGLQQGGFVDLWGKGLAHLASGGTAPDHKGRHFNLHHHRDFADLHHGRKLSRFDARLLHKLERLRHGAGRLDELVDIATRHAGFPGSPMGEDMSPGERRGILGLDKRLLDNLLTQRHIASTVLGDLRDDLHHKHLDPHERRFLRGQRSRLREMLTELQGVTGGGGRIFDLREAIAGLAPGATATAPLHIDELLAFAEAMGYGAFGPKMPGYARGVKGHPGGLAVVGEKGAEVVDLPRGTDVYAHGTAPAAVVSEVPDPVIYADIYIGGEKIDERVEAKIRKKEDRTRQRYRARPIR